MQIQPNPLILADFATVATIPIICPYNWPFVKFALFRWSVDHLLPMQYATANNLEDTMLSYCQLQFAYRYRRMQITQLTNQLLQLTIISFEYETQILSCSFIIATSLFLHLKLQFSGGREWGREGCHSH